MPSAIAFTSPLLVTLRRPHKVHNTLLRPAIRPPQRRPRVPTVTRYHGQSPYATANTPSTPSPQGKKTPTVTATPIQLLLSLTIIGIPTLVTMLLLSPILLFDRHRRRLHANLVRLWLRLSLTLSGIRPRTTFKSGTPPAPGTLLTANRQSALDALALATLPTAPRLLLPPRLARTPPLSWLLRLAGHVPIRPPGDRSALTAALAQAGSLLGAGASVALFPEGKPGPAGKPGRFLTAVFKVARQAGAPVIPVSVSGGLKVCPDGVVPKRGGAIDMVVHAPLDMQGSEKEMAAKAFEVINAGLPEEYQVTAAAKE